MFIKARHQNHLVSILEFCFCNWKAKVNLSVRRKALSQSSSAGLLPNSCSQSQVQNRQSGTAEDRRIPYNLERAFRHFESERHIYYIRSGNLRKKVSNIFQNDRKQIPLKYNIVFSIINKYALPDPLQIVSEEKAYNSFLVQCIKEAFCSESSHLDFFHKDYRQSLESVLQKTLENSGTALQLPINHRKRKLFKGGQ